MRTLRTLLAVALVAAPIVLAAPPAAAAITIDFSGGVMTITGDADDNNLSVTCNGLKVKVDLDTTTHDCAAVQSLIIRGGGGSDDLSVAGVSIGNFTTLTNVELYGGGGNFDELWGWTGPETMNGGKGEDGLHASYGDDTLIGGGGSGWDSLTVETDVANVTLTDTSMTGMGTDTLSGFEYLDVTGGAGANTIDASGFSRWAILRGGGGNDTLFAGPYGNALIGGPGGDTLNGGPGRDDFTGDDASSTADDFIFGNGGIDRVHASLPGNMALTDDYMTGSGIDTLDSIEQASVETRANSLTLDAHLFSGPVSFVGSPGDDHIYGGSGKDFFNGVDGTDLLDGNGGNDQALLYARGPTTTLTDTTFSSGPAFATLEEIEYRRIWGTSADETFDGSGFAGRLEISPDGGTDVVIGNGSHTSLVDWVKGTISLTDASLNHDGGTVSLTDVRKAHLFGTGDVDRLDASGFHGPVEFHGYDGNDRITGGPKADRLFGDGGRDTINAGRGNDKLYGGDGNDTLNGQLGRDGCAPGKGVDRIISCERRLKEPRDQEF